MDWREIVTRLLTAREVAESLSLCVETVHAWVREGKVPAFRLPSGQLRFRQEDIDAWLAECSTQAVGSRLTVVRGESPHA